MNMKQISVLIRFQNEKERSAFKVKCAKQRITYREAINEWVKLSTAKGR